MLLDTGADCSVVPASLARALALPRVGRVAVRGVTGVPLVAPLCAAVVRIAAHERTVEVAAFGDEAILGRDLAAALLARLDGPRARLRISEPRRRTSTRRR
jgi:predicted aspartyl protease